MLFRFAVQSTTVSKRASADRSVHGYKKLVEADPEVARRKAERIVKNTYRTLMTRGLRGCFVFCTDAETNAYFKSFSGA